MAPLLRLLTSSAGDYMSRPCPGAPASRPMPLGLCAGPESEQTISAEDPVPEGHVTIAQRFNVGTGVIRRTSPEGTADRWRHSIVGPNSAVPPGLISRSVFVPTLKRVETLGYSRTSLRQNGSDSAAASNPGAPFHLPGFARETDP